MNILEHSQYFPSHIVSNEGIKIVEPYSFQVRDLIIEHKFVPTVLDKESIQDKEIDSVEPELELPQNQLGITQVIYDRTGIYKFFLGRIVFENTGQIPELSDEDWILYAWGRGGLKDLSNLAKAMQEKFNKKIGIYLEDEIERMKTKIY